MRLSKLFAAPLALAALAVVLGAPPAALAQDAAPSQSDVYLSGGRNLTDGDFQLYFQFMELTRQNIDHDVLVSFAKRHNVSTSDLNSLTARINYGQLIIENPSLANGLEATYGPAINPSAQERALFTKYSADILRYQTRQ